MRHRKRDIKLGRTASHRDAMLRNLAQSLIENGRVKTTVSKAKAVKPLVDRLVTLAKRGKDDLHAIRRAAAILYKGSVLKKLFDDPLGRYGDRVSGFVLMGRLGPRHGDAAPMCVLQMVSPEVKGRAREAREARRRDRGARVAASKAAAKTGAPAAGIEVAVAAPEPVEPEPAPVEPAEPAADLSKPGPPESGEGSGQE
jgi:large subunit ribosomal protein L17